MKSFYSKDL